MYLKLRNSGLRGFGQVFDPYAPTIPTTFGPTATPSAPPAVEATPRVPFQPTHLPAPAEPAEPAEPSLDEVVEQVKTKVKELPQWVKQAAVTGWISAAAFFLLSKILGPPWRK